MNWIDWVIVALLVLAAVHGWWRGAALQTLSILGFWAGIVLGVLVAPPLARLAPGPAQAPIAIAIVLSAAVALGVLGEFVGWRFAAALRRLHLGSLDSGIGSLIAMAGTLLTAWLFANVLSQTTVLSLGRAVDGSKIVRALNQALPDVPSLFAQIEAFLTEHDFPVVFVGLPPQSLPPATPPTDAAVSAAYTAAASSTVKISGIACSSIVEGSGFVVAPQTVVTNAHVVAGDQLPHVIDASGSHAAIPIGYDPQLDVAVLNVPGLTDRPLSVRTTPVPSGAPAAALGYPEQLGLQAEPASVTGRVQAIGLDIYGTSLVTREVYVLAADIRPGNSGGPIVSTGADGVPAGTVIGVIFGRSPTSSNTGYALTMGAVVADVQRAQASALPTSTGSCLQ